MVKYGNRIGVEKRTYFENVYADKYQDQGYPSLVYFATLKQGFSFMTCYSRKELSFHVLLTPFEVEVWIVFAASLTVVMAVLIMILVHKLKWRCIDAVLFAQLVVVSTVFEKPTDVSSELGRLSQFRILLGIWMLFLQILTNGYLGLSITSISAPLESTSVTRYDQLAKPGCDWGNTKCYIDRLRGLDRYLDILYNHVEVLWQRSQKDDAHWAAVYANYGDTFTYDRNRTLEAVRNQSIRKFDAKEDFVLLPYPVEENMTIKMVTDNNFYQVVNYHLNVMGSNILEKFEKSGNAIANNFMASLRLLDLIDPWHIPHPLLGNLSDMKYIENECIEDIEHALVQCGRTVLILDNVEIDWEMDYFKTNYPWIKFCKSEDKILSLESGWSFRIEGNSITPEIFGRLYVAGIVQLLEAWPYRVSEKRRNITNMGKRLWKVGQ
ncbi:hypothetical protein Fcan01_17128 [Folsomia candida]|uniref:Uncharacterized protein n=1 Tax=Folsomia candida TaxID=158441 RepID=A0A226DQL9_FOLCA|nr:hypothetical protein Fcan01_17128 [Folsomia candida]